MCGMCSIDRRSVGICTQDPELGKKLGGGKGIDQATQRIASYIKAVTREAAMIAAAMKHKNIKEFNPEDLKSITIEAATMTGVKLQDWKTASYHNGKASTKYGSRI